MLHGYPFVLDESLSVMHGSETFLTIKNNNKNTFHCCRCQGQCHLLLLTTQDYLLPLGKRIHSSSAIFSEIREGKINPGFKHIPQSSQCIWLHVYNVCGGYIAATLSSVHRATDWFVPNLALAGGSTHLRKDMLTTLEVVHKGSIWHAAMLATSQPILFMIWLAPLYIVTMSASGPYPMVSKSHLLTCRTPNCHSYYS